ncbi:hypothetical protein PACTADRAFT_4950 [Pachysolen tannophilus NRRL Y-2460]|uniref:ATP-dependent RNA helicase n=1 Tax=Pachysolen tannophilus NRRL Y-2460 TaxID=669874 RepID=A0A1E4TN32_PACTA|nr:hypothetical protein PACTADRAFT_4950 [Pachysolen tannophilus NRRL Y-2460]
MAKKHNHVLTAKQRKEHRFQNEKYLNGLQEKIEKFDMHTVKNLDRFEDFPITENTLKGLKENSFVSMTDIQRNSIISALRKNDILAAAKTGSGKTLAFLVPLMERLVHEKVTDMDGCCALIITPTRELAVQIFEVLTKIGRYNTFGCGLVIGGKDFKFESERINKINILIGTPGRILQHMDQSVNFELSNLKMLVLDEADRILDMGFRKTLDSILANLPPERQNLLFSATQTNSVKDLARVSLVNPVYINIKEDINTDHGNNNGNNDNDSTPVPQQLSQSYIVAPLYDKLNILWSFLKTHLSCKIIVFVSSSKQVHFIYETFRKLQPGISLMKLHGRQKQTSRIETTMKFSASNKSCLITTDVVARGIDIPAVDWIVQLDCPEDANTFIHRAGRAGRFGRSGNNLLILTPSEEDGFIKRLTSKKIDIKKLNIKNNKKKQIHQQLQSLCFKDPELKYLGQRAFMSYFKSIFIQKDKEVFKFDQYPAEEFAKSLGLPGAPKIKFLNKAANNSDDTDKLINRMKELKNTNRQLINLSKTDENGEVIENNDKKVRTKYDKMFERKNTTVLSEHYINMTNDREKDGQQEEQEEQEADDDFMTIKRKDHDLLKDEIPELHDLSSKRSLKKATSKKQSASSKGLGKKLIFDDEGNTHEVYEFIKEEDVKDNIKDLKKEFLENETQFMQKEDITDKALAKDKKLEKKRRRQELERRRLEEEEEESEGTIESEEEEISELPDIDEDFQSESEEDDEAPPLKKPKQWFQKDDDDMDKTAQKDVVEIEAPETLEDLEALTARLINN